MNVRFPPQTSRGHGWQPVNGKELIWSVFRKKNEFCSLSILRGERPKYNAARQWPCGRQQLVFPARIPLINIIPILYISPVPRPVIWHFEPQSYNIITIYFVLSYRGFSHRRFRLTFVKKKKLKITKIYIYIILYFITIFWLSRESFDSYIHIFFR